MPLYDDDFFNQDTGNLVNKYGLQRYPNFHKYCNDIPAVILQPPTIFRPYPAVNTEDKTFKGYVEDGELTWVEGEIGIDFVGLYFPDIEFGYNNSFWLIPSDIKKYWKDRLSELKDPKTRKSFCVKNCPYSFLYSNMKNSTLRDENAPPEWSKLTNKGDWCDMIGISVKTPISPPLTVPERHGIIQGRLIQNKNEMDFENRTYEDGRSPGALHPVIMELKKSVTKRLSSKRSEAWKKVEKADSDDEASLYTHCDVIDPEKGRNISLKAARERSGNQPYKIHKLSFKMSYPEEVDPEEVMEEWRPFRNPVEIDGKIRQPLMQFITVERQIQLFIKAFGPEVVDFCFRETPYADAVPEKVKDSYKKLVKKCDTSKEGLWLSLMRERFKRTKEELENSRTSSTDDVEDSSVSKAAKKKSREDAIPDIEVDEEQEQETEETIAGFDEETVEELASELED